MRRWPRAGAASALAAVLASPASAGAASADRTAPEKVEHRVVFAFADERITESSGLLDAGRLMYTVNDSGDDPVIYAVDKRSGATVAVTWYSSGDVDDVEAIAPAPGGGVWVGDIGDNDEERSTIAVYRTEPLAAPRTRADALDGQGPVVEERAPADRFSLGYPDEAHNAETLLVHPGTGRLYVVTKELGGGAVYAAPQPLERGSVNELSQVGELPGYLVDGAFFPDGRHVMLRSYATAAVYTFPALREVGRMRLPAQRLGEGLAISGADRIYLSGEGVFAKVLQILLPPAVARAVGDRSPRDDLPGPAASPVPPSQVAQPPRDELSTGDGAAVWAAVGIFVVALGGWVAFTVSRRRGRRTA